MGRRPSLRPGSRAAERPVPLARPERPAGIQAMSPRMWALVQQAIRRLATAR